jgi:hypothetical protein
MERQPVVEEWSVPDELWEAMHALIPVRKNTHPFGAGRPPTPDRVCM